MRLREAPQPLALDLQDDARLASLDSSGAGPPFEETHLAERFASQHDRQQDRLAAAGGKHGFGRSGPDQEDRVADVTLSKDQGAGFVAALGRDLLAEEPLEVLLIQAGEEGVIPEKLGPVECLHGPPLCPGVRLRKWPDSTAPRGVGQGGAGESPNRFNA